MKRGTYIIASVLCYTNKTGLKELLIDITFSSLYGIRRTQALLYFLSLHSPPTLIGDKIDVTLEGGGRVGHVDILIALFYKPFSCNEDS